MTTITTITAAKDFYAMLDTTLPTADTKEQFTKLFQNYIGDNITSGYYEKKDNQYLVTLNLKNKIEKDLFDIRFVVPKTIKFVLDCNENVHVTFDQREDNAPYEESMLNPWCCAWRLTWWQVYENKGELTMLRPYWFGPFLSWGGTPQMSKVHLQNSATFRQ